MPKFIKVVLVFYFVKWNSIVFVGDAIVDTYVFWSFNPLGIFLDNDIGIIEMIAVFEGEKLQTYNSPN